MSIIKHLHQTPDRPKTYLALEIGSESVKAAVWEIVNTKPQVIQTGSIEEVNPESLDDLITAVDSSVSKAQAGITPEPQEVIFSLPESWLKGDSIDNSKKPLLKEITQKLDLKAIGFVVVTDALINYLKHKQGSPPTTILLGLSETEVVVTIVKNGTTLGTQTVGRSDDLVADVEEGIARFGNVRELPSSMVLYDGHTDLESEKQNLTSYNWQETLPFLHIPKIDSLLPDETVRAVAIAGGYEVIAASGGQASPANDDQPLELDSESEDMDKATPEPNLAPDSIASTKQAPETLPDMSSEFGFSTTPIEVKPAPPTSVPTIPTTSDFVVNNLDGADGSVDPDADDLNLENTSPHRSRSTSNLLKKFSATSKIKLPSISKLKLPLLLPLGVLVLILIFTGAAYAYWYLPTANIEIKLNPNLVDTNFNFTISEQITEADIIADIIPGVTRDITVTDSGEIEVTGEKLVGDRASGTITLYNRTNSTKVFPAGTKLTGPDNLVFTIDQEVTIASASTKENSDLSITTNPSQSDVKASASNIGANFNLGSGTEFRVANFDSSSFIARAKTDLSGGTSRQITAVSKADQDALIQQLKSSLDTKVIEQVELTATGNAVSAVVIPGSDQQFDTKFSADIGTEAKTLKLDATLTVKTMTFKKSDVSFLIEKSARDSISQNYKLEKSESELEVVQASLDDNNNLLIEAKAKAKIIPIIDTNEVVQQIKGRFPSKTQRYFTNLPNFSSVEIEIKPLQLPSSIKTFPRIDKNISITITTED